MISDNTVKRYCCEDISRIENYGKAIADNTQIWCCHHRMELIKTGAVVRITYKDYKSNGGTMTWNEFQREFYRSSIKPEELLEKLN